MRLKVLLSVFSLALFFGGATLYPVLGAEIVYKTQESFVEYEEDVDDDLYIMGGENISVLGNVSGDLFVFGGSIDVEGDVGGTIYSSGGIITINGNVEGNVFVAGGQIDINGYISRSVYAATGTLNINGSVGEDAMVTGGKLNIIGDVGDDVRAAGGIVRVDGDIGGDLLVGAGQIDVRGNVEGDAYISGDSIIIRSEIIVGDLVVYGKEKQIDLKESTEVGGDYKIEEPKYEKGENISIPGSGILQLSGFALFFKIVFSFTQGLGFILLGWLLSKFAPVKLEGTIAKMRGFNESAKSFGVGFLAIPVGIFLIIFLAITIIGWPTITVLMALFTIATTLVVPIMGLYIGRWILEQFNIETSVFLPLTIGVLLVQFLRLIPFLGWLFYTVIFLVVIGAMLRMQYERYQMANESK